MTQCEQDWRGPWHIAAARCASSLPAFLSSPDGSPSHYQSRAAPTTGRAQRHRKPFGPPTTMPLLLAHPPEASHDASVSDGEQSRAVGTLSHQEGLAEVTDQAREQTWAWCLDHTQAHSFSFIQRSHLEDVLRARPCARPGVQGCPPSRVIGSLGRLTHGHLQPQQGHCN